MADWSKGWFALYMRDHNDFTGKTANYLLATGSWMRMLRRLVQTAKEEGFKAKVCSKGNRYKLDVPVAHGRREFIVLKMMS